MSDLLPPNAADWEHVIANIGEFKLDFEFNIAELKNPAKCPAKFLPWLAWERSVDYWDHDWHESVKRDVVAKSISIHAKKGTRSAIEGALLVIGIIADVTAWHEFEPKKDPFTFEVIAWINEQNKASDIFISADIITQAHAMIEAHKSERDKYLLQVGVKIPANLGVIAVVEASIEVQTSGVMS